MGNKQMLRITRTIFLGVLLVLIETASIAQPTETSATAAVAPAPGNLTREVSIMPETITSTQREPFNSSPLGPESPVVITDWPQVQRDPQRTGYSPEVLGTTLGVAWTHPFQPEKIYPQVQAIVYSGTVFVGTEMGNLYALNAKTGTRQWVYKAGGPILNSVAASGGKVFFGAMDGAVYALDVNTGNIVWKNPLSQRLGFSTAPVIADNKVMLGGRNGVFYALNPDNGATLWQYNVGSPVLQTAAWDNGRVVFGAMNMHVYAITTATGTLAWQSLKLHGMAFKDYWPMIYQGKVVIWPMPKEVWYNGFPWNSSPPVNAFPFAELWGSSDPGWEWVSRNGPTVAAGRLVDIPDAMNAQNTAMANYEQHPSDYPKSFYILDEATGQETFAVPHWTSQTMHGAPTPPCIDRDGKLIVPIQFIRGGWGRLDLTTRRITDILYDHTNRSGQPIQPGDYPAGMGNDDESLNVTCTSNLVFAMHTEEMNANYTGIFDLDTRRWTQIIPGHSNRQMSTNTQGGGGNPASISEGMVYHISWHELIARSAQ